jgi:hypothetical protein
MPFPGKRLSLELVLDNSCARSMNCDVTPWRPGRIGKCVR